MHRAHPLLPVPARRLLLLLVLVPALALLAACGETDDGAARAQELQALKAKLKAHNAKYVEVQPGWQEIRNKVIPARQAYLAAKGSPGEAEAKAAFEAISAESAETIEAEEAWRRAKLELEDAIARLER